jgi:predicted O-methyltransferase YrrM
VNPERFWTQSERFLVVTRHLLKQYGRAFTDDEEARGFFTELYLKERPSGSQQRGLVPAIPTRALGEVFPGIESTHVQLLNRFGAFAANRFLQNADALVTPMEMATLAALVAHRKPRSIFEIGTYRGLTTASLALNAPEGCEIRTLDLHPLELEDPVARIFQDRGVERLVGDSKTFDFSSLKRAVDFVFVDGSHSAPEVEIDTRNALEIVAPGGVVAWHDFNPEHPEVVRVLREIVRAREIVHVAGTALVLNVSGEVRGGD